MASARGSLHDYQSVWTDKPRWSAAIWRRFHRRVARVFQPNRASFRRSMAHPMTEGFKLRAWTCRAGSGSRPRSSRLTIG